MLEFKDLCWLEEEVLAASEVKAGRREGSDAVCGTSESKPVEIEAKCVGDCQNSAKPFVS